MSDNETTPRPRWHLLGAVFCMSAGVLVLEVSLTRLFSVVLRYHFVFLVTSVAICGLGFGGLLAHGTRSVRGRYALARTLVLAAVGFGVLVPACLVVLLRWLLPTHPGQYVVLGGVILLPFICAGLFLSVCFEHFGPSSGRLYAADLSGAAAASVGVVGVLQWLGGINACFAAGVLGALAGVGVGGGRRRALAWLAVLAAGGGAVFVGLNRSEKLLGVPPVHTDDPQVGKPLYRELAQPDHPAHIEYTEWNAFARTDVVRENDPATRYVYTDGHVPTNMQQWDGRVESLAYLRGFLGYLAMEGIPRNRALFIGPGGGLDVLMALVGGYRHIEGVEINASILNVMRRYRKFNGGIYDLPNVHIASGDGRSYVKRSRRKYDLIYLALTQTATSGNVGLSLVESYIHTTDALRDYLAHLAPRGRVAFITQEYPLALRLFATAVQVLTENGAMTEAEACRHVALIEVPPEKYPFTPYRRLLLVAKKAFPKEQAAALLAAAKQRHLVPVYIPHAYPGLPFSWVARGQKPMSALVAEFTLPNGDPANVTPCPDDKPFFLDMTFGVPPPLYGLCLAALVLSVGLTGLLAVTRRDRRQRRHLPWFTGYFALLGTGFMLAEVALAQKFILFLGYPTLTLSVILFSLLLGGAAGSRLTQCARAELRPQWIAVAALVVSVLLGVYAVALPAVESLFLRGVLPLRIAVSMALLLPLGFCLGMPFPLGVRELEAINRDDIPWMWGVNGVTSVLGSVLAAIGAKLLGFHAVLAGAAVCYLTVALVVMRTLVGTMPATGASPETPPPEQESTRSRRTH